VSPLRSHPGAGRLRGLDGLRGLACLGVVLVHVWLYTGNNDPSQPALMTSVIGELRLGLLAFFVLSAFLLASPWLSAARGERDAPALGPFLLRRAARILPGYWVAIVAAFGLLWQSGSGRAASPGQLPIFLVMGQNQVAATHDRLIPPAWSLCVEITFYALLPVLGALLVRAAARRGARTAALALSGALATAGVLWSAAAWSGGWPATVTTSLPTYLPVFACGIAAAALTPRRAWSRRAMLVAGGALVVLDGIWHHDGTGAAGHVLRDLPAGAGFGLVVAGLAAGPAGLLELAPVRWLGTVSYGTYLWHMPVLFLLRARGLLPATAGPALAAVLAPTLALAACSWYGVERPVLTWAARRAPGRGRSKATARWLPRQAVRDPSG
jgi:peptidoglycan/LPS O-acetylase OafA/YrhL